jgi:hypothetical protein
MEGKKNLVKCDKIYEKLPEVGRFLTSLNNFVLSAVRSYHGN